VDPASPCAQTLYTCGQATGDVKKVGDEYRARVELADAVHVGRSAADARWNFDPTQVAVRSADRTHEDPIAERPDAPDRRADRFGRSVPGAGHLPKNTNGKVLRRRLSPAA
jgi:hypothetical protein